jgi:hypothetical protein
MSRRWVALMLLMVAGGAIDAPAQVVTPPMILPSEKLFDASSTRDDLMGWSVAVDGDLMLVGIPNQTVQGAAGFGMVHVYARRSGTWVFDGTIDPFSAGWGVSVALQGGNAFISTRTGLYMFTRQADGTWRFRQGGGGSSFSSAPIAVDGDILAIGLQTLFSDTGRVEIRLRGSNGSFQPLLDWLDPGDLASGDRFGQSVAVSGNTVVVGAPRANVNGNDDQGAAYIFTRSGTTFTRTAKLTAPDGVPFANFGGAVAISGDTAIVGARCTGTCPGAAYLFTRDGNGTWTYRTKLTASDGHNGDYFGFSLAMQGRTAMVGALYGAGLPLNGPGAVYLFSEAGGVWTERTRVAAPDGEPGDWFGYSVGLSGQTFVAGAPEINTEHGAAYVFTNTAPELSSLGTRVTFEDTPLTIDLGVSDPNSDVLQLPITATSSDQTVVPNGSLTVTRVSARRRLTIAPRANQSGPVRITLSAFDGLATGTTSFELTVLPVNDAPTLDAIPDHAATAGVAVSIPLTLDDPDTPLAQLAVVPISSDPLVSGTITVGGSGNARTLTITPPRQQPQQHAHASITVLVDDGVAFASRTFQLTVEPLATRTYYLAEGSTGGFFDTDLLLANPNGDEAPVTITFFRENGTSVIETRTLPALSRSTIRVATIAGMEATAFSTLVESTEGWPLVVERTMRWDASGYGAHGEKAVDGAALRWYFAEGSQGFFSTFFLLVNPGTTANIAHITYLREFEPPITRDYPLAPTSRFTVDVGTVPELINRSFGAIVTFDQPGVAERAMYFGRDPLWTGGHDSVGATAPSTTWFLAEGATGSYFNTFILLANPNAEDAIATVTFLPGSGAPITRDYAVAAGQRVTLNIATQDPSLASADVSTRVEATRPIVVERSQYWPAPDWYEAHNSFGVTATGTRWGLAEGRVGGANAYQTFILLANPGDTEAAVTVRFLRADGRVPLVKTFSVPPTRRFTIAITGDAGSMVPELSDEAFGASIESTRAIAVERAMYSNANGVIWAAGTSATATPLP